jgi:predicted phosphoribosyltransferase
MDGPRLPFADRRAAGRALAGALARHAGYRDAIVLALPRGGVPVGYELASSLDAPLDVFVVRKLGVPGHEELAFGALASGDARVLNHEIVRELGLTDEAIRHVTEVESQELRRRERLYRQGRGPLDVRDRTAILVDDGLATGSTMRAAVAAVRALGAAHIVVAVPTGSPDVCQALRAEADEVICLTTPEPFHAVGLWYRDFTPTSDEEVQRLLADATPATVPSSGVLQGT